nr:UDP-glycosyltransferase 83A1-like [Tanacetum cinerariifolium]
MKSNHVLVVPYPAQGHVIPLMDAAQRFTRKGLKVTFVNTEDSHKRVVNACSQKDDLSDMMQMVAIPDGMEPWEDRNDLGLLTETMFRVMPEKLEELINNINNTDDAKITCIIADYCMGWISKVAQKMGIRLAVFCSGSAAVMAVFMSVQKKEKILEDKNVFKGSLIDTLQLTRFVKDYVAIKRPLTALLKKNSFKWSNSAQMAFDDLKTAMVNAPVLALPNFQEEFIVETDASDEGLSTYEKELSAVVYDLEKWRGYLLDRHFKIKTDHFSLKCIMFFHVSQLKPFKRQPTIPIPLPHCTKDGLITAIRVAVLDKCGCGLLACSVVKWGC